jgi:hypothetical protein
VPSVKNNRTGTTDFFMLKKECALHILAPAAVACDIYLIRRSAHLCGAFFTLQESNFL